MIALPVLAVTAADVLIQTSGRLRAGVGGPADGVGRGAGRGVRRHRHASSSRPDPDDCCPITDGGGTGARRPRPRRSRRCSTGRGCSSCGADEVEFTTEKGQTPVEVTEVDLGDPVTDGLFDLTSGRLPRAGGRGRGQPGRCSTRATASATGCDLTADDAPADPTIVGVAESTTRAHASRRPPARSGSLGVGTSAAASWLVDGGPVSWPTRPPAQRHRRRRRVAGGDRRPAAGLRDPARGPAGGTDDASVAVIALIVVMALIEVVLLAGPAFAVSARKQQRSLALMAATGGTPKQSRRVIVAGAHRARQRRGPGRGGARHRSRAGWSSRCCRRGRTTGSDRSRCRGCTWRASPASGCSARSSPRSSRPTSPRGRTSSRCSPAAAATGAPSLQLAAARPGPARRRHRRLGVRRDRHPGRRRGVPHRLQRDPGRARDDPAGPGGARGPRPGVRPAPAGAALRRPRRQPAPHPHRPRGRRRGRHGRGRGRARHRPDLRPGRERGDLHRRRSPTASAS